MNIRRLKKLNKKYFAAGTKEFFGDLYYKVINLGSKSFLMTATKKWSLDKPVYIIKSIDEAGKIGQAIVEEDDMYLAINKIRAQE